MKCSSCSSSVQVCEEAPAKEKPSEGQQRDESPRAQQVLTAMIYLTLL